MDKVETKKFIDIPVTEIRSNPKFNCFQNWIDGFDFVQKDSLSENLSKIKPEMVDGKVRVPKKIWDEWI